MATAHTHDSLIYKQDYTVRIHEINAAKQLTIPALIKLLHETSMQHLLTLQASSWHLAEQSLSWVLLKQRVDVQRPIAYGEKVTVVTYPSGFDKFFGYRDYLVFDTNKKLAATSATMWSLIDTATRKIARVPDELRALAAPPDIKLLQRPTTKIQLPTQMVPHSTHPVQYYDMDWNDHVNSAVLARLMLASLLSDPAAEASVQSVHIQYKNESRLGDQLHSCISADNSICKLVCADKLIAAIQVGRL